MSLTLFRQVRMANTYALFFLVFENLLLYAGPLVEYRYSSGFGLYELRCPLEGRARNREQPVERPSVLVQQQRLVAAAELE